MNYKYIVYTKFSMEDEQYYPCMCSELEKSKLLDNSLVLNNIYALRDTTFKEFKIKYLHILKENILYICEGDYTEEDLKDKEPIDIKEEIIKEEKEDTSTKSKNKGDK